MPTLAEEMKANSLEAQKFSRKHLVLELDYSEASIQELESHAGSLEYAIPGGASDENIEMLTRIWGAYLGEALRRACGGEWVEEDGQPALRSAKATVRPQEQVRLRLKEGDLHNLAEYFGRTKEQL